VRKILPLCLLVFLALGASTVGFAGKGRIAFVHITIEKGALTLGGVKLVDGDMKRPRRLDLSEDRLYFEVLDVSGKRLYEGTVPDPSNRRLEYADDDGTLHSTIVEVENAFLSVKIPFDAAAHTLRFYRIEAVGREKAKLAKAPEAFGSVTIELGEVGHEE
jgi:hypothetical protein